VAITTYLPSRPLWHKTGNVSTTPTVLYLPPSMRQLKVWAAGLVYVGFGQTYAAPSVTPVGEVFQIETLGSPDAGLFTLVFDGEETGWFTFDESAADIVTGMNLLANVNSGDFVGAGGALPTAITLTAAAVYAAAGPLPSLKVGQSTLTSQGEQFLTFGLHWPNEQPAVNPAIVQVRRTTHGTGTGNTAGAYAYLEADTQEIFDIAKDPATIGGSLNRARYLYLAAVSGTSDYRVSGYLIA